MKVQHSVSLCVHAQVGAVAVAQEAEVVAQGIVVDRFPVAFHEGRDQQQQGAFGLMEIGDDAFHQLEGVARRDDDLRGGHQLVGLVAVQVVEYVLQGLVGGQAVVGRLVGHPLFHDQLFRGGLGMSRQKHAYVIEALQRAHRGGAYGHDVPQATLQPLDALAAHGDELGVHLVPLDGLALDGLKGSGAHMQGHLLAAYAFRVDSGQHLRGEVQSGGRRRYRTFDFRVDRLVGLQVALLRLAVQIGGDGQHACRVEDVGEGVAGVIPAEANLVGVAVRGDLLGRERHALLADGDAAAQRALLPLLQVAYEAGPGARLRLLKHKGVVVWRVGLQAEHLDAGARLLLKQQARLDHPRVVIHQQGVGGHEVGDVLKLAFFDLSRSIEQQLRFVSFRQGEFGNALIGQRIVVILHTYLFRFCRHHI